MFLDAERCVAAKSGGQAAFRFHFQLENASVASYGPDLLVIIWSTVGTVLSQNKVKLMHYATNPAAAVGLACEHIGGFQKPRGQGFLADNDLFERRCDELAMGTADEGAVIARDKLSGSFGPQPRS